MYQIKCNRKVLSSKIKSIHSWHAKVYISTNTIFFNTFFVFVFVFCFCFISSSDKFATLSKEAADTLTPAYNQDNQRMLMSPQPVLFQPIIFLPQSIFRLPLPLPLWLLLPPLTQPTHSLQPRNSNFGSHLYNTVPIYQAMSAYPARPEAMQAMPLFCLPVFHATTCIGPRQ